MGAGGQALEEGEIESVSEEEIVAAPAKRSRRYEGEQELDEEEGEDSEAYLEVQADMREQGRVSLREQTGWHSRGHGEALERGAFTDEPMVTLQRDGPVSGGDRAGDRRTFMAQGGPPASPIFILGDQQGRDNGGAAGSCGAGSMGKPMAKQASGVQNRQPSGSGSDK